MTCTKCKIQHQDTITCETAKFWWKESLGQFIYDDAGPECLLTQEEMLAAVNRWYVSSGLALIERGDLLPSDMKASVDPEDEDLLDRMPQRKRDGGRVTALPNGDYRIQKRTRPHLDPACRCDACTLWDNCP